VENDKVKISGMKIECKTCKRYRKTMDGIKGSGINKNAWKCHHKC
jgi:hypothetical protein